MTSRQGSTPGDDAKPPSEQRTEPRVTINKEFESFEAFVHEYVTNVSRSGVFVRSDQPLPVGTQVDLKFTVILDGVLAIEGVGEVVRVQDDPPGMGVVFRELSRFSADLIDRLLTAPSPSTEP
ncbi:MAG: PilZ domain-containing protein [Sandaracinaceae bacterium]